jgi:hypothetical protein
VGRDGSFPRHIHVFARIPLVHRHVQQETGVIPVALNDVHGAAFQKSQVRRPAQFRRQPTAPVIAIAEHQPVLIAELHEPIGRIGDILEIDQIQVGLGEATDFLLDALGIPFEKKLRLQITAATKDSPAIDPANTIASGSTRRMMAATS